MTEQEIIETNKLIDEFLGNKLWVVKHYEGDEQSDRYEIDPKEYLTYQSKGFQYDIYSRPYHSSWDRLMPVIEKIESLGFNVVIGFNTYCGIVKSDKLYSDKTLRFESVHPVKEPNKQYTWTAPTKIEGSYISVSKFINWYINNEIITKK